MEKAGEKIKGIIGLRNESGLDFVGISGERYRQYEFPTGQVIRVDSPQWLNVSPSGGHRILDMRGVSHYVPFGWGHLFWEVYPDEPHFVK